MAKRSLDRIDLESGGKRPKKSKLVKGAWSEEEDNLLKAAVDQNGSHEWSVVAENVPGRSKKQCRDRYKLKLDPSINHQPFSQQEDDLLTKLQKDFGNQWTKIAKFLPGRTENSVKSRFASIERSRTREWTPEEDMILRSQRQLNVDFLVIAEKHLPKRSEHAVRKRWERLFIGDLASKIRNEIPSPSGVVSGPPALLESTVNPVHGVASEGYSGVASYFNGNELFPPQGAGPNPTLLPDAGAVVGPQQRSSTGSRLSNLIDSMLGGVKPTRPLVNPVLFEDHSGFLEPPNGGVQSRKSDRSGNMKKHTTSVMVLQSIIGEPIRP